MLTPNYKYIAIDQYNNHVMIREYPRKELMQWAGVKNARKMYYEDGQGNDYHVGYVVSDHWFDVWGLEGERFIKEA